MFKVIIALALILYVLYGAKKIKKEIHVLQLNSYMNDRYYKWITTNLSREIPIKEFLPLCSLILLYFNMKQAAYLLLAAAYLFLLLTWKQPDEKKKLVITSRVKRLIFTVVLLVSIILIAWVNLVIIRPGFMSAALFILILLNIFSFVIVLISNSINLPVEYSINNWYINDAKKKLAARLDLTTIGLTGSYGKTSAKYVLSGLLSEKYSVLMTPESYNTPMGVTKTIRNDLRTINEVFIVEMGAKKKGDIKEICDIVTPKIGVLTSIGEQHLETFKNIQNIINTKFELIDALPENGLAFINIDDENIKAHYTRYNNKTRFIRYGIDNEDADYRAGGIKFSARGTTFTIMKYDGSKQEFSTKLLGRHNVYNILAGVAVAAELGVDLKVLASAVKKLEPVSHRLELKKTPGNVTIIDDAFNSNPVGSKMALEVLKEIESECKILITPGMIELGKQEYELNKAFGNYAAGVCDYVILVGPKQTKPVFDGLWENKFPMEKIYVARSLKDALAHLQTILRPGAVALFENDLPDTYNE